MTQCLCLVHCLVTTHITITIELVSSPSFPPKSYSFPANYSSKERLRKLITIMPLVVPGLTSNSGDNDQTNKWMNQLMGKKIGDQSNETVSCPSPRADVHFLEPCLIAADICV
jgi:hypothetical protein